MQESRVIAQINNNHFQNEFFEVEKTVLLGHSRKFGNINSKITKVLGLHI